MSDRAFYYDDMIDVAVDAFQRAFRHEVTFRCVTRDYGRHGLFTVRFHYLPKDLEFCLVSEKDLFQIEITEADGAESALSWMSAFDNVLEEENVIRAVELLKLNLDEYEPMFFLTRGRQMFVRANGRERPISAGEFRQISTQHQCRALKDSGALFRLKQA